MLGHAYSIRVWFVAGSVQSSIVDVLEVHVCRTPRSVPSFAAPSATCWTVIGRPPTGPNICRRVRASFTGRWACFAAIAARKTCDHGPPLLPNPPPVK
jgi:hypothetical protein